MRPDKTTKHTHNTINIPLDFDLKFRSRFRWLKMFAGIKQHRSSSAQAGIYLHHAITLNIEYCIAQLSSSEWCGYRMIAWVRTGWLKRSMMLFSVFPPIPMLLHPGRVANAHNTLVLTPNTQAQNRRTRG